MDAHRYLLDDFLFVHLFGARATWRIPVVRRTNALHPFHHYQHSFAQPHIQANAEMVQSILPILWSHQFRGLFDTRTIRIGLRATLSFRLLAYILHRSILYHPTGLAFASTDATHPETHSIKKTS